MEGKTAALLQRVGKRRLYFLSTASVSGIPVRDFCVERCNVERVDNVRAVGRRRGQCVGAPN